MLSQTSAYPTVVRDPTSVVGRRIAAFVIDTAIAVVMFIVLAFGLAQTREYSTASRAENVCSDMNDVGDQFCVPVDTTIYVYDGGDIAALLLLPVAYFFLNDALLTGVTGFSIGKGLVGLRVIRQRDGRLCGVGPSMLRWLLWAADGAPYCFPLVGLITGLSTKGHRRVGDMAAGTLVVDKRDVGTVPIVPGLTAPTPPPWGYAPTWVQPPGAPPTWGAPPQQPAPPTWGAPPQQPAPPTWGAPPQQPAPPSWNAPQPAAAPQPPSPAWGDPAPPSPPSAPPAPSWVPAPSTPEVAPAPAGGQAGVDHPLWDDARDTYIQWDPELAAWVQWDDTAKEWHPIV